MHVFTKLFILLNTPPWKWFKPKTTSESIMDFIKDNIVTLIIRIILIIAAIGLVIYFV